MKKTDKSIVAVLTADIVHSRRYNSTSRKLINSALKKIIHRAEQNISQAVHSQLGFSVTVGNEFQFVFSDVASSFDLLMTSRSPATSPRRH